MGGERSTVVLPYHRFVQSPSAGEALFRAYLRQRRLKFDYEAPSGGRRPDFLVHDPAGDVVCEVFEPVRRLPGRAGAIEPYEHLRRAFRGRKRKQGAEAKKLGLPYVIVLAASNSDVSFDDISVTGAMFGAHGVTMPFDAERGEAREDEARWGFLRGGGLHTGKNTRYSAVAVLTKFNPTLHRVERAYQEKIVRHGIPPGARAPVIYRAFDDAAEAGTYDEHAAVARLTVYHNPYASAPLSMEALGGPHDHQWHAIETSPDEVGYTLVAEGRFCWELPRDAIG
jgi:hypothetical protein